MNLIIDIGNSTAKAALVNGDTIIDAGRYEPMSASDVERLLDDNREVEAAILCAVSAYDPEIDVLLSSRLKRFVKLDRTTPVPIGNAYGTPETLGMDRLAAAVGAVHLYGDDKKLLVVDLGSAITVDTVIDGVFMGGNISPGASLRYKSLSDYTSALPLCSLPQGEQPLVGKTTREAIEAGVVRSIVGEIEGYIYESSALYGEILTIFTGGDADYFAKKLKNTIFVNPALVTIGLNVILEKTR